MRPSLLDPLFAPAGVLPGIGPKNAKLFDRLLDKPQGARVVDVLFHLPQATVDRRARPKIRDAVPDTIVTIEARVIEHREPPNARSRAPFKVLVEDDTGDVELVFFLANHEWVRSRLPIGATRWISGKLELWDGRRQMVHPDRVMNAEELERLPLVEPVYGLTEGLYQRAVARAAESALKRLPRLPEWISEETLSDVNLPSFAEALGAMHRPGTPGDIDPASRAATRLAYDELFANQLALLLMRARMRVIPGRAHRAEGALARRLEAALPFSLTRAQREAVDDIRADLRAEKRMLRLLQGDVGSGKTVVALLVMAEVIEAGRQATMMAPTEILARQHYERIAPLAGSVGLRITLLTGRDKASARRASLRCAGRGDNRHRRRYACVVSRGGLLRRSRARSRRRAASVRRPPTARARLQGRGRRSSGDDCDADPAFACTRLFRRHGCLCDTREAAGAPADRYARVADRTARRGGGSPLAGSRLWRARLLDLSVGGGERDARCRRGGRPRASAQRHLRRRRRTGSRQNVWPRAGCGHGALPARDNGDPGRDNGGRGRRRRAGGDDYDRRARRTLWASAIAPIARARWSRPPAARPVYSSTRDRSAKRRARGSRFCARPRTVSVSPRRT